MRKIDLRSSKLAINGAPPIRTKPWLDNFTTDEKEKQAVLRVMDTGYLSLFEGAHSPDLPFSFLGGPEVQALESEWSDYYRVNHSISMNSATSGLFAAIGALGKGYGDEVIVSPYTMSACALAPLIYGAIPIFADVDAETGSLDPKSIVDHITSRTKAILVVHQFGIPADMESIMKIAKKHSLKVIEDCAQAHGAKYKDRYVGGIGDIGVFSLNVNKTIQSGEGGICVTNDDELSFRLQLIRNHGEAVVEGAGYKAINNIAGFNYRLTEIQAAIGREQLKKLDSLNDARIDYVEYLIDGLSNAHFLRPLLPLKDSKATYYIMPIKFDEDVAGVCRNDFVNALNQEGGKFYQGYVRPLYLQPIYQNKILFNNNYPFSAVENKDAVTNYSKGSCPTAERLYYSEMIINEHVRLPQKKEDMSELLSIIRKVGEL